MTFGALAAWQAWALLAAAAAIAAALFLLKLRPPRTVVPSLLVWRRVLDEARELTLWERIRRAVSLVLTVLVAVLLAAAITRPSRDVNGTAAAAAGRLLVVLDSSWSMQAGTRSGETRWDRAVAEARRLFAGSRGREIALATTADGLVEGPTMDAALVETALERLLPSGGDRTAWPRTAEAAAVHFITDGAMMRATEPGVIVHSVYEPAPNVAILAFTVRRALAGERRWDAYLEIANFAPVGQTVHVTLERENARLFDQPLQVAATGVLRQVVPIAPPGNAVITARIRAGQNALTLDDEAVAWIGGASPLAVTVVGTDTGWLQTALEQSDGVDATFITPEAYGQGMQSGGGGEVVVFDGWAPDAPPKRPALLFAPPSLTPWLSAQPSSDPPAVATPGSEERRPRWEVPGGHPVVDGVDPYTLVIDRARAYTHPDLVPVAASARGTALVSVRESGEARAVVVAFGPGESNLASAPGFPVLLANALEWLARPSPVLPLFDGEDQRAGGTAAPGLVAFVPSVLRLADARGRRVPLWRLDDRALALVPAPGLYTAEGSGFRAPVAVNAGDPELSNLSRSTLGASAEETPVPVGASGRPWWVYCAVIAFGLILAEWWTWQRRITV